MKLSHERLARKATAGLAVVFTVCASAWLAIPASAFEPPVVVGTSTGLDPDKILVTEQSVGSEYRYEIDLPEGATLRALADPAQTSGITGEVLLEDSAGELIGAYDQPLALSQNNSLLPSTYEIDGSTLVQVVDFTDAVFPVVIDPIYTSVTGQGTGNILARAFVGVPSNYVYNPSLGSLHDYCTKSPDEYPSAIGANADFRGPCARHDMCYGGGVTSKLTCDNRLLADMRSNCEHYYTSIFDPNRAGCKATAEVYWAAVVIAN